MSNAPVIDFVVTWVDGNDPEWQKDKKHFSKNADSKADVSKERYRDFGYLKYWFRCIEKNAPWVNKIHFVTYGHIPKWLNVDNPKINVVKHDSFIKKKYLPTFNSCAIEVNIDKITGLSEKFVYFNDDMYINKPISDKLFFNKNRPKSTYATKVIVRPKTHASKINLKCNTIVKKYKNNHREFSIKNGFLMVIKNIMSVFQKGTSGYSSKHAPAAFLKETFAEVRSEIPGELTKTTSNRFRQEDDVSQWIFEYWQMATGKAEPRNYKNSKYYATSVNCDKIVKDILNSKHPLICINDDSNSDQRLVMQCNEKIMQAFEKRYPQKSSFEKGGE